MLQQLYAVRQWHDMQLVRTWRHRNRQAEVSLRGTECKNNLYLSPDFWCEEECPSDHYYEPAPSLKQIAWASVAGKASFLARNGRSWRIRVVGVVTFCNGLAAETLGILESSSCCGTVDARLDNLDKQGFHMIFF